MRDERRRAQQIRHRFQKIVAELRAQDDEIEGLRRDHGVEQSAQPEIPESLVAVFDEVNGPVSPRPAQPVRWVLPRGLAIRA